MQKSSADRQRIESYEDAARTREYGGLSSRRKRAMQRVAVWFIAVLVALLLFGVVASFVR